MTTQPTVFDIVLSEAAPGFAARIPNKAAAIAAAAALSAFARSPAYTATYAI